MNLFEMNILNFFSKSEQKSSKSSYKTFFLTHRKKNSLFKKVPLYCLKQSGNNTEKKCLPPPKKRGRFWGGGNFFWEDPLGSMDHPSIIMGCLKVV